jgi:putative hydrolase of the HAD superfamily
MLPRFLFFDLDDTLVRFSAGQPDFWVLALQALLPAEHDVGALRRAIDPVSDALWGDPQRAFRGRLYMHEARREIAVDALCPLGLSQDSCVRIADYVTDTKEEHVRLFDGATETLRALRQRGHRMALLTNGSSAFQRRKIERYALAEHFELILIEGELGFGKPDRRVFQRALDHFGILGAEALMIGDNLEADIAGARALGLHTVWHDVYGTGLPPGATTTPDHVLDDIAQLCEWPQLCDWR